MARKNSPIRRLLNPSNYIIPIIIGLVVIGYMLYRDFNPDDFKEVTWTWTSTLWIFVAFLMVAFRDLGYMFRIRVLTEKALSWRKSFDVIMLWEFASSITPSVVGGSSVAILILNRESISVGRSTAVVMVTAFLDELFYVLMVPLLILLVGTSELFPTDLEKTYFGVTLGTQQLFWAGYGFILFLILLIFYGIFLNPKGTRVAIKGLFSLPILRRWKEGAIQTGDDLVVTSAELKGKSFSFWLQTFGATFLSWTARFWVVNFIIIAFTTAQISFGDHFLIYARQLVMWVIMLISPTPGGTGIAEFAFNEFLKDFIMPVGIATSLALLWRLLSYYPYLLMGNLVLPGWIRRVYLKRKLIRFKSE